MTHDIRTDPAVDFDQPGQRGTAAERRRRRERVQSWMPRPTYVDLDAWELGR